MKIYYPDIDSSRALPLFIGIKMPQFIAGCLEGMLLLTLVGTTSGTLYATSVIIYRGLLKNRIKKETAATRFLILVLLLFVSIVVSLDKSDLILTWTFMGAGLRGAVSIFPLIISLFYKKTIDSRYVILSMIAAPIFTLMGKILLPRVDILPVFWGLFGSLLFISLGIVFNRKKPIATNTL